MIQHNKKASLWHWKAPRILKTHARPCLLFLFNMSNAICPPPFLQSLMIPQILLVCVQLLFSLDILSLFHLLYFLLMPTPLWRPFLLSPPCMSAHIKGAGHIKCQANTSLLGFQTQWGAAVKSLPCQNTGKQSITHNVWGSPCPQPTTGPGQGGSTSLEDLGGRGLRAVPFPTALMKSQLVPQPLRGTAEPTRSCSWNSSQLCVWSAAETARAWRPHFVPGEVYSVEVCWKICFYSPLQQFNAIELLLFNGRMLEDLLLLPQFQHAAHRQGAYLSRSLHD